MIDLKKLGECVCVVKSTDVTCLDALSFDETRQGKPEPREYFLGDE
jgi:hypothetical protein